MNFILSIVVAFRLANQIAARALPKVKIVEQRRRHQACQRTRRHESFAFKVVDIILLVVFIYQQQ
jgi:hypothetical protein